MDDGSGISLARRAVASAARLKTTRLQRLALMAEEDDLAAVFDECAEDEEQEIALTQALEHEMSLRQNKAIGPGDGDSNDDDDLFW